MADHNEIQNFFDDLDARAYKAILDKTTIKRSPYLPIIELVVSKFSGANQHEVSSGKAFSQSMKNREAMKFVDLWERVSRN